jgi:hypothetical protein
VTAAKERQQRGVTRGLNDSREGVIALRRLPNEAWTSTKAEIVMHTTQAARAKPAPDTPTCCRKASSRVTAAWPDGSQRCVSASVDASCSADMNQSTCGHSTAGQGEAHCEDATVRHSVLIPMT